MPKPKDAMIEYVPKDRKDPLKGQPQFKQAYHFQPWMYILPQNIELRLPFAKTELERQLIKRFNWDQFVFQFPPYLDIISKEKWVFDVDKGVMAALKMYFPRPGKARIMPKTMPKSMSNAIYSQFEKYRRQIGLPEDMQKAFPLFYGILKDTFITNYVNVRNHKQMTKVHNVLLELVTRAAALLYRLYKILMENIGSIRPIFTENKENMACLKECEAFLSPLFQEETDPLVHKDILLVPIVKRLDPLSPEQIRKMDKLNEFLANAKKYSNGLSAAHKVGYNLALSDLEKWLLQ